MNYDRPALLESLASEYVLGTLRGPARRRFERVLASLHNARMAVATWESRLHPLAQSVPESAPSVQVWKRIESHINGARAQRTAARAWRLNWLRPLGGVLSGIIMGVLIVKMAPSAFFPIEAQQEKALSQSYVGLLLDQTGIPSVLASTTRHGKRLKLKILKPITVPAGQALTCLLYTSSAQFRIRIAGVQDRLIRLLLLHLAQRPHVLRVAFFVYGRPRFLL